MASTVPVRPQQHLLLIILSLAGVQAQLAVASEPPGRASPSYRCDWCPRRSTASLLPPDAAVITGATCGYGASDTAEIVAAGGGFHIAAVSAGLFREGRACGACYQLRCRDSATCAQDGVKVVVVTDAAPGTNITAGAGRFLLSDDAFAAMTNRPHGGDRLARVAVDVDFRRIPCAYKNNKNLFVKVDEASVRGRGRLALRFLFQGGQTDIVAVEVAQAIVEDGNNGSSAPSPASAWQYMTRRERSPSVWRTSRVPTGPLRLRIVITAGSGGKWLRSDGAVLPAEWVSGAVYDTGLRVADVAASTCGGASCDGHDEDGDEDLR